MKKIFSIILLQFLVIGFIFGARINSKEGYDKLSWGASFLDAQKAGYKLTLMSADFEKDNLAKLYTESVAGYKVVTRDRDLLSLEFHYYNGKLFAVKEKLDLRGFDLEKLESRYGTFARRGINKIGNQYMDPKVDENGNVSDLSIIISCTNFSVSTIICDWNVYKNISVDGREWSGISKITKSGKSNTSSVAIVDELSVLADKLVQEKLDGSKPSFAFVALTTDYRNTLVDNYITDALSEAMFNTGKIKIIERGNLEAILSEQKFQSSGLVNEQTAKSIGMIAGVDFVCYGTLKDIGGSFTVNARVVDVETGEIVAMSRVNVTKDAYLSKQLQSAVGSSEIHSVATTPATNSSTTTVKTLKTEPVKTTPTVANNAWKVTKFRDDFGGFTQYVFILNSSDERKLVVIYKQSKNSANDRVIAGIYWTDEYNGIWNYSYSRGIYDIKGNNSTSITKDLDNTWHVTLDVVGKKSFPIVWDEEAGSRWLIDIICKSDSVAFRRDSLTRRFQTAGLLEKMEEYGVTWAQIDAALANEEF